MGETRYIYEGKCFQNVIVSPIIYEPDFFNLEIELESDVYYEIRKNNNILPYRLNQSTKKELNEIQNFYYNNKSTFFFIFNEKELIGSILILCNYIQSLTIAKKYQRNGYGTRLTQYAINFILNKGYKCVELSVLDGNIPAHKLYLELGFKIQK